MANQNRKRLTETLTKVGIINECQFIPSEKDEKVILSVLYKGKKYKTNTLWGKDIDEFAENLACGIDVGTSSVALEKVNEAHGYAEEDRQTNLIMQLRTYAKSFAGVQFEGRHPHDSFDMYVMNSGEIDSINHWIEMMPLYHEDLSRDAIKKMMVDMLKNQEVLVIDNKVFSRLSFDKLMDKWETDNDRKLAQDIKEKLINDYIERYAEKV